MTSAGCYENFSSSIAYTHWHHSTSYYAGEIVDCNDFDLCKALRARPAARTRSVCKVRCEMCPLTNAGKQKGLLGITVRNTLLKL